MLSALLSRPAVLLGDLVASRDAPDRRALHRALLDALASGNAAVPAVEGLTPTIGDEFQGGYATVAEAVRATLLVRTALRPENDVRFGVGVGAVTTLGRAHEGFPQQDGPGWWAARSAIVWVARTASRRGVPSTVRTHVRADPDLGLDGEVEVLNAYLVARDQIVTTMDSRDRRILHAMLLGTPLGAIAEDEGVTMSAISQRAQRSGAAALAHTERRLR